MKKTLLFLAISILLSGISFAGKPVQLVTMGSYTLSSDPSGQTYKVTYQEKKKNDYVIWIQIPGEHPTRLQLLPKSYDDFIFGLKQTIQKYNEWTKTAHDNNVTSPTSKSMGIEYSPTAFFWKAPNNQELSSAKIELQPNFEILEGGACVVSFYNKVVSAGKVAMAVLGNNQMSANALNQDINNVVSFSFSDVAEIEKLIEILDLTKIKEGKVAQDLFK
ncbi:MAG: hypothetical protein LBQ31_04940 [Bacteroidales bacterium]|jgi:hypothetical protein|nr:hypothetical protein [Bacteroidales bacterium]